MKNDTSFKIYNASAGSGKTFTLAVNYLSLLLTSENVFAFQHILAITFTNKAVGEMKSRIMEHLIGFSQDPIHGKFQALLTAIQKKTGLSESEISQKAKAILPYLLINYAGVEISTIDSFTHRLIRTFAKDLGLSTNFEIELESQEVVEEAVHRLVDQAGEDPQLTRVLIDFALEKTSEDKSGDITKDLLEAANLLNNENNLPYIESLASLSLSSFADEKLNLRKSLKEIEKNIVELVGAFFEALAPQAIDASSFSRGSVYHFFKKAKNLDFPSQWDAAWMQKIATDPLYPKKTDDAIKATLDKLQPAIVGYFEKVKQHSFQLRYQKEILKYLTQTSVLWLIQYELEALKKERNILFINDFNKKISEQIRQQPAPFIYERLGEKFHQYFVDEFQDTSQMQWKNLVPLIENALVSELKSGETGELNLVGDAKQSIYAWRGGDAQQFIDLYEGNSPFPIESTAIPLQTNYRSETHIVEFNNRFFSYVASQLEEPSYQKLYASSNQEIFKNSGEGFVQINFFEAKNTEEASEAYVQKTLEIIQSKVQQKEASYADFCVLVRNKKQGIAVANFLSENDIPLISSETLLIYNSPKVKWLTHVLECLQNPTNQEASYEVFSFLVNQKEESEQAKHLLLAELLKGDFFQNLKRLGYALNSDKLLSLPLYDVVISIQKEVVFLQEEDAYVQFFLEEIFRFSKKKNNDLNSFLTYWEQAKTKRSIVAPEGQNAVQIQTIHKSKGLQYPIVIFPFADNELGNLSLDMLWLPTDQPQLPYALVSGKSNFYTEVSEEVAASYLTTKSKKILEDVNILYVTLTRAEKEMYLLSKYSVTKSGITFSENSVAKYLYDYLATNGYWEEGTFQYSFGKSMFLGGKTTESTTQKIHSITPRKEDVMDMLTSKRFLWAQDKYDAIERGNIVHMLLASIYSKEDISSTIEKALLKGEISDEESEAYQQLLTKICTHSELYDYYQQGLESWNEKEILHQGKLLRPDRVVFTADGAVVIDYKTGEASASYNQQINEYAQAVEALGHQVEKKIIVYIQNLEIIPIKI